MKISSAAGILTAVALAAAPALATDNLGIERLATCQDSWLEWKSSDPARLKNFIVSFKADFVSQKDTDPFFVPKASQTVAGLPVAQVFPESVGMAVGFSVLVNATFDKTKATIERKIGKPFKCEPPSDNMRTCGSEIADKKTIVLMAEDNAKSTTALVGCFYFYEK
jgi:hypothetical protein